MKSISKAIVSALFAICTATIPALAQVSPEFRNDKIIILENKKGDHGYWTTTSRYFPPDYVQKPIAPDRMAIRELMMKRRILEEYAEFLSPLDLPRKLRVIASDCAGERWDSPYYAAQVQWMDMCYSFIQWLEQSSDDMIAHFSKETWWTPTSREQLVAGVLVGVLLHETGHAVYHLLDAPVFGRQEDAADQMAAFIPLQFDKDTARVVIRGTVLIWHYLASIIGANPPLSGKPVGNCPDPGCGYSDEHGTASQRMYNTLCIAYGADPASYQDLVSAGLLPPERAKNCGREYQKVRAAFSKTVLPFINRPLMEKVKARKWFQPQEMKDAR